MTIEMTRRGWLAASAGAIGAGLVAGAPARSAVHSAPEPFGFAMNTSTISGQKLTLEQEIELVAKVGYSGIEPWTREMEQHVKDGGSMVDLGKKARDLGVAIVDVIGFFEWAVDDEARRAKGLEQARHDMEMTRQLGGTRIAAPPFGATEQADLDLRKVAERYRALLEIGDGFGVTPLVEIWGFSKPISRLGEAAMVAIESGHPRAAILADIYHIHKGGSGFGGLHLLGPDAIPVIHMNDYPDRPRDQLSDADRVYPGDGVAPLSDIFKALQSIGFHGHLSLELFNREYWKQDALTVAKTGLEKMKAAVHAGLT
ncbi:sugar phosphate isomerase/epimerase family protein [Tundrisphaera lichenicola]|uniref:sugar phosphate isomerase/epimerase family protein n=1 Tax=Tundrisphaera lichenicola TaxID=2029860 RepID=UPI003EBED320